MVATALCATLFVPSSFQSAQAGVASAFLEPQRASHAPSGFVGLCDRYPWVCDASRKAAVSDRQALELARKINRSVNRGVKEIADRAQYGVEEHWALPTARGGDCEDLVLLKMKLLQESGVAPQSLLIATVLDKRMNSHAVLVLRTARGDLVLDNLTDSILPWESTGYTFLKLQNPRAPERWQAVMAGGLMQDRPTASR